MLANQSRILVVDDVLDNLFLMQTILEAEGYAVETADDGTIALDKMHHAPPDLVLLDIMMPGLNGYEVTRKIRQKAEWSDLPVVLLTAHDEYFGMPYREIGANDLLRKPVDFDELLSKVASYLNAAPSIC